MKIGDILIAVDECEMDGSNRKTLTIGKEYEIIDTNSREFVIIDDENTEHYFYFYDYENFFKLNQL